SARATGYLRRSFPEPALGTVTAMLLNFVSEYSDAYIYSDATEKQVRRMRLVWRAGNGPEGRIEDGSYPYEFSLRLHDPSAPLRFRLEVESVAGVWQRTPELELTN
ncbi:MAG: hypothetical protein ACPL88_13510, partial [Bryobacteraceae bacterium]